jgi:hypothetical protein
MTSRKSNYATLGANEIGSVIFDQPSKKTDDQTIFLNPNATYHNIEPGFKKIDGLFVKTGLDKRGFDPIRDVENAYVMPPVTGSIPESKRYTDPRLSHYHAGKPYKDYGSITAGDITYYVDKKESKPFIEPIFVNPERSIGYEFTDPMGVMRPQFVLEQAQQRNPTAFIQSAGKYPTTFNKDSSQHRADIISRQLRKTNETRYETLYGTKVSQTTPVDS